MSKVKNTVMKVIGLKFGEQKTPARFGVKELKEFTDAAGRKHPAFKIYDKNVVITNVSQINSNSAYIYFRGDVDDFGMQRWIAVNTDMEITKLEGAAAKLVLTKMEKGKKGLSRDNLAHSFYIGADPEFFVENSKGELLPAFEFLNGKDNPNRTPDGQAIYWDGFQGEFTISAGGCLEGRVSSTQQGLHNMLLLARKIDKGAKISNKTLFEIDENVLMTGKEEHVSLGCMPSFNIYGHKGLDVPDPRQLRVRSAGGHMHFGFHENVTKLHADKKRIERIIKTLDKVIGVACVALLAKYDRPERRKYYGKAGEYRTPPHGLEYRTLSNAWMYHPLTMNLVFDLARKVVMMGEKGLGNEWDATEKETIEVINTCNVKKAQRILIRNKKVFIKLLQAAYGSENMEALNAVFNVFHDGIDTLVADTGNFSDNWGIGKPGSMELVYVKKSFRANKEVLIKGTKVA